MTWRALPWFVPAGRVLETFFEADPGREAQALAGPRGVELAPRLAVRTGRVPADLALVADRAGDQPGQVRDADFLTGADVHRLRVVVPLQGQAQRPGRVVHVEELAGRAAVTPEGHERGPGVARLGELADHRRDDVRGLEVEIVPGPVQVDGQHVDGIHPVLGAVGLALHQQHLLGQAVGRVGLLRVAVPDVVLAKRRRGVLRVRA